MSSLTLVCLFLTQAACGGADDAGGVDDGRETPPPAQSVAQGAEQFEVTVDASALLTAPLERQAFVDDACRFAGAEQMASFFTFHTGSVAIEADDGLYAGSECSYAMQDPEVFVEVQFSQAFASSTEEIELAGLAGVLRNVSASTLENRARVQIPFRIEGSPVEVATIQFHVRGVPAADESELRVAIDALGVNLIERLGLAAGQ